MYPSRTLSWSSGSRRKSKVNHLVSNLKRPLQPILFALVRSYLLYAAFVSRRRYRNVCWAVELRFLPSRLGIWDEINTMFGHNYLAQVKWPHAVIFLKQRSELLTILLENVWEFHSSALGGLLLFQESSLLTPFYNWVVTPEESLLVIRF